MAPIVTWLIQNGLGLLAGAVKVKGQEFVEDKLGVKLDEHMGTEDGRIKLAQIEADRESDLLEWQVKLAEVDLKMEATIQNAVTERWKADMASDSWLSKNIRPLVLIFILGAYFFFALMSLFDMETQSEYVELLGQWGMLIMTAYFGGRTVEKIASMRKDK